MEPETSSRSGISQRSSMESVTGNPDALSYPGSESRAFRRRSAAGGLTSGGWLKPAPLVGHADEKHRLFRILHDVDNAVGLIFEIDVLTVGDEMDVAVLRHRI